MAGAISALRLPRRREMLPRQNRVGVLERVLGIEMEAARFFGQHLERPFELDERAELERVERDAHDTIESPHGSVLLVRELNLKPQLRKQVQGRVHVFDVDLGLLSYLHAADEPGRPFRGENAMRSAVEHPKSQRGPARRLAGPAEAIVLLVVFAFELGAPLAEQRAETRVIARAVDAKLQLAFDAPVTQAMVRTVPCHGGSVAVMAQTAQMTVERVSLETERLGLDPIGLAHADGLFEATVASRPELLPWMPWAKDPTLEGGKAMAAKAPSEWLHGHFPFAVLGRESEMVLGVVGLDLHEGPAGPRHRLASDHGGLRLPTQSCTVA